MRYKDINKIFHYTTKLLTTHMRDHAIDETNTPTNAQIIIVRAFFIFSSSQLEVRNIIPHIITAITAITATYFISAAIILATT